jgi:hypothetical protein
LSLVDDRRKPVFNNCFVADMGDPRAKLRAPTPHAPDQAAPRTPTALNKVKPNRRTRAALARRRPFAADTMDDGNARKERSFPIA